MPEIPAFSLDVTSADGRTTVAVTGEVDLATAGALTDAVRDALASGPATVDLRDVVYLDSSGIRALNTLLRECSEHGWTMTVCSELRDPVVQILELTGMLPLLPLQDCEAR